VQIVVMKRRILQIRMKVVRGTLYYVLLSSPTTIRDSYLYF
jgi:hypothetical protein